MSSSSPYEMGFDIFDTELPEDGFFINAVPRDEIACKVFIEDLDKYCSFFTDQTPQVRILQTWVCRDGPPPKNSRAIPDLWHQVRSSSTLELNLIEPLQYGEKKWAQVWRGSVGLPGASDMSRPTVVVKIFQESLIPTPSWWSIENGDWKSGARQAKTEAWAYKCMSELQGSEVPLSYCFVKLRFLNSEEVSYAHIMEYIDGHTGDTLQEPLNAPNLVCCVMNCLLRIHECGVSHEDVRSANIVIQDRGLKSSAVFVDFAFAVPIVPIKMFRITNEVVGAFRALMEMGVKFSDIEMWIAKTQVPEIIALIDHLDTHESDWRAILRLDSP